MFFRNLVSAILVLLPFSAALASESHPTTSELNQQQLAIAAAGAQANPTMSQETKDGHNLSVGYAAPAFSIGYGYQVGGGTAPQAMTLGVPGLGVFFSGQKPALLPEGVLALASLVHAAKRDQDVMAALCASPIGAKALGGVRIDCDDEPAAGLPETVAWKQLDAASPAN